MTDETSAAADAAAQASAQQNQSQQAAQPPIQIRAQFLRDVSFEAPNGPLPLVGAQQQPAISVNMNIKHRPVPQIGHEVILTLTAESKLGNSTLFLAEVHYGALVTLAEGMNEQAAGAALVIEVPRLIFPYVRRIASDLVIEGGFPPLALNPVDFVAFARNAQVEAAAKPDDATLQ
jgi:preprotein translocase subunit SecB